MTSATIFLCAAACAFTNDGVRLEFDAQGRMSSLRETVSGRELIRSARPFATAVLANGRRDRPVSFRNSGDRLVYSFADATEISFSIAPFAGGWTFAFADCTHTAAQAVVACELAPACTNYVGALANMISFPDGWDSLFAAVRKIRSAGLKAGIHTLTGCISPEDPWIATDMNRYLVPWRTYTLAVDMPPDADSFETVEAPQTAHDTALTYFGNGNAFRIGAVKRYAGRAGVPNAHGGME